MKYRFLFGFLFFFIFLCFYFFYLIYTDAQETAISELNSRQIIHATQAQKEIEAFFENLISSLANISESNSIISLDDRGKNTMDVSLNIFPETVTAITRVDESGKITYTIPYNEEVIGRDISDQKHIQKIMTSHKAVVSDVFTAVQGYTAIALHVPVFKENDYQGALGVLINFNALSKHFLDEIKVGETGYPWMVSGEGTELYCPVPGHVGKSIFETSRSFPTIISMAKEMVQGRQGVTTYLYDHIRDQQTKTVKKHAVYLPVKIVDTSWSIVVASAEEDVLASLVNFKNKIIIILGLLLSGSVIFSYHGMKAWGIIREREERQKAEDRLKLQQEFIKEALDAQKDTFFVFNPETGKALQWNKAFTKISGYSDEEIKNLTVPDSYYSSDDLLLSQDYVKNVSNGGKGTVILDFICKNGGRIPTEYSASILKDKESSSNLIIAIGRDISERKQNEEALKASKERYRRLYTNTPAMLHSIDPNGQIITVSNTWLEKLGYQREEVIGRKSSDFLTEESRRNAEENILPDFFKKGYCKEINYQFVKKNGEILDILLSATSEKDDEGNIIRSLAVLKDITDKKQLERHLRQAYKMEAIGTMAGGIAHDFNNILAIILGNAEMALLEIPDSHPSKHNINQVLKASIRAKDLVKQILAFTRQTDQKMKPLDIIQAVEDSLKLLRSTIPTSVEIRKRFELQDGVIMADPTQFHQLMINLCTNGAQAMQGKGILEVSLTEATLTNKALRSHPDKQPGQYLRLSVSDTGEGMDQATIDRIFDPFFTTKDVGKGTGMGLSVVHGVVKNHDGFITVESEPGKGSTFHVFLNKSKAKPIEEREVDKVLLKGNEKILFVDDEIAMVNVGRGMLELIGYSVTTFTSSFEALEMFRSQPGDFDLIITDMAMPDLTGKELTAEILKIRPDMPIILCTGYSAIISKEDAEEIGIREFCLKPLSMKQLAKTVRKVLDEDASHG